MQLVDGIANGLTGALNMARARPGWEERMDLSADAVFRSFWAVPLALPGLALATVASRRLEMAAGETVLPIWALLLDRGTAALVIWGLVVLFYVYLARRLEVGWRISAVLIANNYATFLGYSLFGLGMGAAAITGSFSLIGYVWPLILAFGLWLDWGILRRGLGLKPDGALVAIIFLQIAGIVIAMFLSLVVAAVLKGLGVSV